MKVQVAIFNESAINKKKQVAILSKKLKEMVKWKEAKIAS